MKCLASVSTVAVVAAVLGLTTMCPSANGFAFTTPRTITSSTVNGIASTSGKSQLFFVRSSSMADEQQPRVSSTTLLATASLSANSDDDATTSSKSAPETSYKKKKKTLKELRKEGGPFSFNTPIGALNLFAVYYFFVSVALGIPWVISCKFCQLLYWITGNRFDPKVRNTKLVT